MLSASKIMKSYEHESMVIYRAECTCMHPDHDLTLIVEKNEDTELTLNMTGKFSPRGIYTEECWPARLWRRIKLAANVLFHGYMPVEHEFIMSGNDQIRDFAHAIESARQGLAGTAGARTKERQDSRQ